MTKQEFKQECDVHVYTGSGKRINAIYFDWKQGTDADGNRYQGFKYMVYADTKDMLRTELYNELWQWVTEQIQQPSYMVQSRYAVTDTKRFKVPLSL
jgi:hypothetical protein